MRADGAAEEIVGAQEPFAVPAVTFHGHAHFRGLVNGKGGLIFHSRDAAYAGIFLGEHHKLPGYHKAFGL